MNRNISAPTASGGGTSFEVAANDVLVWDSGTCLPKELAISIKPGSGTVIFEYCVGGQWFAPTGALSGSISTNIATLFDIPASAIRFTASTATVIIGISWR